MSEIELGGFDDIVENAFIDSCAFDPSDPLEFSASEKIFELQNKGMVLLEVPFAVDEEISHPNTPLAKKAKALGLIHSIKVEFNHDEVKKLRQIKQVLTGAGKKENYRNDSLHLLESSRYCQHFITTDNMILKKRSLLEPICGIKLFKPSEFLAYVTEKKTKQDELKRKLTNLHKQIREKQKPQE
jgi:hypothetical protein